jgi:hypothetical protein
MSGAFFGQQTDNNWRVLVPTPVVSLSVQVIPGTGRTAPSCPCNALVAGGIAPARSGQASSNRKERAAPDRRTCRWYAAPASQRPDRCPWRRLPWSARPCCGHRQRSDRGRHRAAANAAALGANRPHRTICCPLAARVARAMLLVVPKGEHARARLRGAHLKVIEPHLIHYASYL